MPLPPAEHLEADGHVNFTGHWKCMEAGGELDAVFADMGIGNCHETRANHKMYKMFVRSFCSRDAQTQRRCAIGGYLARKFMASFGWGKGTVCRTYEQNGIHARASKEHWLLKCTFIKHNPDVSPILCGAVCCFPLR